MVSAMRQRGFTIAEALLVVGIVGILAAIAAPAMTRFLTTQAVRSASYDLFADLVYARSEAISRGGNVTILGAAGDDWKQGWTITAAGVAAPIRVQSARDSAITFKASSTTVVFDRNGRTTPPAGEITFNIVPKEAVAPDYQKRCVRLDPSGRPRSTEGACS
jgi:prepilin-type N-terminal cleavage/methylation domain-containing protein